MQRFTGHCDFELLGEYVLYTDHIAEVSALKARLAVFEEGMPDKEMLLAVAEKTYHRATRAWIERIASSAGGKEG